jgi:hypothetical protein
MANQIKINLSMPGSWVPLANINITDTNTHTYLTDPPNSAGNGIDILRVGNILGSGDSLIKAYALWIFNNENQTLTVQPITNIVNDGSLPDIALVPAYNINAGLTDIRMFPFNSYPIEYLSAYLFYSTAPTGVGLATSPVPQGVYAVLYIYYG